MHIGFFDSGIGGATVLAEALRRLPDEDYVYFSDTKHVPYGEKSKEEVKGYIFQAVEGMAQYGLKALVIACNTATSIAVKDLRERYPFPIIGMEPAVKPAVIRNQNREKRVLVFATSLTLQESKFKQLVSAVDPMHIVDSMALPGLVELAEKGVFAGGEVEAYLNAKFSGLDMGLYGTVVLGCTHFPLFKDVFRMLLPEGTDIIDGAAGTIKHMEATLKQTENLGGGSGKIVFGSSGSREKDRALFEAVLDYQMSHNR